MLFFKNPKGNSEPTAPNSTIASPRRCGCTPQSSVASPPASSRSRRNTRPRVTMFSIAARISRTFSSFSGWSVAGASRGWVSNSNHSP